MSYEKPHIDVPGQYGRPHVYARDVHSGAGNCVCGNALLSRLHVQAALGVPLDTAEVVLQREEALQEAGRLRARVEDLEGVVRAVNQSWPDAQAEPGTALYRAREALGLDGSTGHRDINAEPEETGECRDIYPGRPIKGGAPLCHKGCGIPVWRHAAKAEEVEDRG